MAGARKTLMVLLTAGLMGLAGCEAPQPAPTPPSPTTPALPPRASKVAPQSEISRKQADHYARVQADLLARGLMRVDGGGPDTPFTQRNLVDNFIRIALFDEYTTSEGRIIAQATKSALRRWEQPIRMKIEFGPSVPLAQRAKDRSTIASYIKRLSHLTGLPMHLTNGPANFTVLILNEDERRAATPRLQRLVPAINSLSLRAVTEMDRSTFCLVFAYSNNPNTYTYSTAVAVIRAEHPDLLRLSCFHEELAQGLGLANDSPAARPSIFNDDEEFALLTHHDELLLQMLYDDRLRPGMTVDEVRPIAEQIAAELMGGSS